MFISAYKYTDRDRYFRRHPQNLRKNEKNKWRTG